MGYYDELAMGVDEASNPDFGGDVFTPTVSNVVALAPVACILGSVAENPEYLMGLELTKAELAMVVSVSAMPVPFAFNDQGTARGVTWRVLNKRSNPAFHTFILGPAGN